MMLMVAMVAIVVLMTIPSPNKIDSTNRNLLEFYTIQSPSVNNKEIKEINQELNQPIKVSDSASLIQWRGLDN
jgi:hypothetical protein